MKWDPYVLSWNENDMKLHIKSWLKKLILNIILEIESTQSLINFSPFMAQELLQNLIKEIDNTQRDIDIKDFKAKEIYLTERLKDNGCNCLKSVGFLIQNNIRQQALANTSDYYYFKIVSAPNLPYKKAAPSRAIICILFFIVGFLFSLLFITVRNFFLKSN